MAIQPLLSEPDRIEEPQQAQEYWHIFQRVASTSQPIIVSHSGTDFVAVVSMEHLELLREILAQQEAERRAVQVDWTRLAEVSPPHQLWLEGEEAKPFF